MQRDPYRRDMEIEGSEDCLYLNVYTPEVRCYHNTSYIRMISKAFLLFAGTQSNDTLACHDLLSRWRLSVWCRR